VFYAIAFRSAQTGPADKALDALDPKRLLVMGVANMAGKPKSNTPMVQLPRRGPVPFGPAALTKDLPEPLKAELTGGGGRPNSPKHLVLPVLPHQTPGFF